MRNQEELEEEARQPDQREYSRRRAGTGRSRPLRTAGNGMPGKGTAGKRTTGRGATDIGATGKGKVRLGTVLLILLCCLAGAGAGLWFSHQSRQESAGSKLVYEANVISGDIPGKSPEERQRELNSQVEEGMLNMSMNITPSGSASGSEADRSVNWLIENPSNQGKLIRVEITRDDTGEKIYETGAIRPGNYVESAPPDVRLEAGEYPCTAVFYAYQEETETLIGQAAVKIKLTLQE